MGENIIDLSASTLALRIREKKLTSEQVVQAFLKRIEEVNPSINAIVELNPNALDQAKELDKYFQETGNVKGPLHGVPVTVKEQFAVSGFKQTQGGVQAFKDHRATIDCTVIARIKEAGAIILGTTNAPQMMMSFDTANDIYGTTNNAKDSTRSAGGSSGGEGAIVGSRGSPLGFGTDIGGSIRTPAHYNGIHGLKPSKGRVPLTKCYYLGETVHFENLAVSSELASLGPMSRFVEDLDLGLRVISGADYVDSWCVTPAYSDDFHRINVSKLRVAYFHEISRVPVTAETKEAIDRVASFLKQGGAQVTEVVPPILEKAFNLWSKLMGRLGGESYSNLVTLAGGKITDQLQWTINHVNPLKLKDVMELEGLLMEWKSTNNENWTFMKNFDVIISPVMPTPALLHGKSSVLNHLSYTVPWNVTGYPAIAIGEVGKGKGEFHDLPIGVQLIAAPFREDIILAVAKFVEDKLRA